MANENARKLAKELLDDFGGAGYYADPRELQKRLQTWGLDERAAVELLRGLLRRYAREWANDDDVTALANSLEGMGVR